MEVGGVMGRIKVHDGKWRVPGQPGLLQSWARSHPNRYWDDGTRLDAQGRRDLGFGILALFGLWIVVAWTYIFIANYTWTTAAVVTGVVVALSLITVGIRRTTVGIFRFIWWVILMAVMTDVVVRVGVGFTDNMHGVLLPFLAGDLTFAVWLYSTVKITRLVF